MIKIFARLILVLSVILSYVLFAEITIPPIKLDAPPGVKFLYPLQFSKTADSYYQMLSEGFLKKQLSLSTVPKQELLDLPDPYNAIQNQRYRGYIWRAPSGYSYIYYANNDLSLYHNKFYMYFGPLAAVSFFIPVKLLTNYYPSESLAVIFFLSLGFMMQFLLMINIKEKYFPRLPEIWIFGVGLLLAFANNSSFLLARGVFYEVAISSAYCAMSFALYFLYKILVDGEKIRNIILFSLFSSLAAAGRPHFILVCLLLIVCLFIYFLKHVSRARLYSVSMSLFSPALCVVGLLGIYNYKRFGSIVEFGQHYMLLGTLNKNGLFSLDIVRNITNGFYSYFIRPYYRDYFDYHYNLIKLSPGYALEHLAGIIWTAPIVIFIIFLPGLIRENFKNENKDVFPLLRFSIFLGIIPVTIIMFLLMLSAAAQRYVTDFISYLIILAIISVWFLKESESTKKHYKMLQVIFIVTASISIVVCYRHGLFKQYIAI